jgi:hypothetical protein
VREVGEGYHLVKDFGLDNTLDWAAVSHEGFYQVEVTARSLDSGATASASGSFQFQSLVTGDQPVITPTAHPMVYLYSAPSCPAGQRMRVTFRGPDGTAQGTPFQACQPGRTMNFYLAGLLPQQAYSINHVISTGENASQGPSLSLTPQSTDVNVASQIVQPQAVAVRQGVLLQATVNAPHQVATDLSGNILWYYPGNVSYITRPEADGRFFAIFTDPKSDPSHQLLREFDLAGMTLLETNAARVSEQLNALGKRTITSFHHEARLLPGGNILVLASVEQIMDDVQGPGPVDILGDMIIILDSSLQVVWTWDAFDHLDVTRQAVLGETCNIGGGGCPPFYQAQTANDWLHGNCVQLTPDGNILYSARHQDWLIKIDYQNGIGTGDVIWRMGAGGDFSINSSDPHPWFSHQHDPQFLADGTTITLFDNGNTRNVADPTANSRGQVLQVDEQNRIVTPAVNADLGLYSFALGAAQKLANGNYHFLAGWLPDSTTMIMEVDPTGQIVYALHVQAAEYRAFRMADLYSGGNL